ncbi:MAG: hypothetical protein K6G30_13795 [Acetatifactor sp.]|nr:hypothetical protein [Acetatifactor sp.]
MKEIIFVRNSNGNMEAKLRNNVGLYKDGSALEIGTGVLEEAFKDGLEFLRVSEIFKNVCLL